MKCVYQIKNLSNGKKYIGSTVSAKIRWQGHINDLKNGKHHSVLLQRAWDKYGEVNFQFEILEKVKDPIHLVAVEQVFLDYMKPEYNICKTAGNCLGRKFSKESKQKMSNSHKGKKLSEEHKAKIGASSRVKGFCGKKHTEEAKALIREKRALQVFTDETRLKLSKARKGEKNHFFGKKHSAESLEKMAEASRGKVSSRRKPIERICVLTGRVKEYPFAAITENDGFSPACVSNCCRGKQKSHGGYYWQYINNKDE